MKRIYTPEEKFSRKVRVKTIFSFTVFILFIFGCYTSYKWIARQPKDQNAIAPFRSVFNFNSTVFATATNSPSLAKEFPKSSAAKKARFNGSIGTQSEFDPATWKLQLVKYDPLTPFAPDTVFVSLDEIKKLPKTEVIFNFKCIEGWSQVTWWGGVRFSDFLKKYPFATKAGKYAAYSGLITPDGDYYVGIDMASMLHPQTILCYELNGKPLPDNQGAPLRLIIPVKYGIKHLKRIGTLYFSDSQPADYWAERGYDYYAGL